MGLDSLNMLAIFLAAVAKFILGGLWYSPFLFGKVWMKEVGLSPETLSDPTREMILAGGVCVIFALSLAVIIAAANLDFTGSLVMGLIVGIGLLAANSSLSFAFEGRSFRLYMIYAGQYLCESVLAAGIIGYFQS